MYLNHEGNRKGDISPSCGQPNTRVHIYTVEAPRMPRSRGGGWGPASIASSLHLHYARVYTEFVPKHTLFSFFRVQPTLRKKRSNFGGRKKFEFSWLNSTSVKKWVQLAELKFPMPRSCGIEMPRSWFPETNRPDNRGWWPLGYKPSYPRGLRTG